VQGWLERASPLSLVERLALQRLYVESESLIKQDAVLCAAKAVSVILTPVAAHGEEEPVGEVDDFVCDFGNVKCCVF